MFHRIREHFKEALVLRDLVERLVLQDPVDQI
jgi:hypothetical protein